MERRSCGRDRISALLILRMGKLTRKLRRRGGGCFIFSTHEWDLRTEVSFTVVEFPDPSPISGEVRWQIPWGKSQRIPGIGVKFVTIREDQRRYLCDQFYL
jgi:Tfp pilus assembly protein PilZ